MKFQFFLSALLVVSIVACAPQPVPAVATPIVTLAPTLLVQPTSQSTATAQPTIQPTNTQTSQPAYLPKTFFLDPKSLAAVKNKIAAGDKSYDAALAKLVRDADSALKQGPFTLTAKTQAPPSGDKRDYQSQGPYYWPDPTKPNGLPYINRDGEHNPEVDKFTDERTLNSMVTTSQTLALAYFFKGDARYAERAALLLRTWFINPDTRMNPNLNFAQGVPGKYDGSGTGIIDSHNLPLIVDTVGLIAASNAWSADDDRVLRDWFAQYLDWLQTSKNGKQEAKAENNHGTFYDSQIISIALFLNKKDLAVSTLESSKTKHIAQKIEPDGKQPLELRRTKSWDYSVFNLQALFRLASLGDRANVDLWNYRTSDGRSIRAAFDFLASYATGEKPWMTPQIVKFEPGQLSPLARQAATSWHSPVYRDVYFKIAGNDAGNRLNLTIPGE